VAKTRLGFNAAKRCLDSSNLLLDLLVLFSDDGEGFYFSAIGLIDQEA
jgi:hypothetical protein